MLPAQLLDGNIGLNVFPLPAAGRYLEKPEAFVRKRFLFAVAQLERKMELLFQLFFKFAQAERFVDRVLYHRVFFEPGFAQGVERVRKGMMNVHCRVAMEQPLYLHL
jgi:hypothetical protein